MEYPMNFGGWREKKRVNGFLFMEMIIVLLVMVIVVSAFLPVLVQIVKNMRRGEAWEELSRQGVVVEETIYGTLRFAHDITVTPTEIRCRDVQNNRTGFSVKGALIYRILSDGNEQPLTGSNSAGPSARIWVRPYGSEPYFSQVGNTIYVSFLVYDRVSRAERPCRITVVSLPETERDI